MVRYVRCFLTGDSDPTAAPHDEHSPFPGCLAQSQNKTAIDVITLAPPMYSAASSPKASRAKPPQNSISWTANKAVVLALQTWGVLLPHLRHFLRRRSELSMANAKPSRGRTHRGLTSAG